MDDWEALINTWRGHVFLPSPPALCSLWFHLTHFFLSRSCHSLPFLFFRNFTFYLSLVPSLSLNFNTHTHRPCVSKDRTSVFAFHYKNSSSTTCRMTDNETLHCLKSFFFFAPFFIKPTGCLWRGHSAVMLLCSYFKKTLPAATKLFLVLFVSPFNQLRHPISL